MHYRLIRSRAQGANSVSAPLAFSAAVPYVGNPRLLASSGTWEDPSSRPPRRREERSMPAEAPLAAICTFNYRLSLSFSFSILLGPSFPDFAVKLKP